jgi:biofilm PGA synthesis N-glycosyltransferase PgaC
MTILFWISFAVIAYTYFGYPLCLAILKKVQSCPVDKGPFEPKVSVVIAACNEERNIVKRVDNLLAQAYPAAKIEIIIVSDGSTDRTAELARRNENATLRVVELSHSRGKAAALNAGMAQASGELVLFCDARQIFEEDVISQLASNFADPAVGCVSGELILLCNAASRIQVEMGAYWKYEKWIRKAESASGSVVGATGAIYAIRKKLFKTLPQGTLLDDVLTPMNIVMQGYRCIFDGSAVAYDILSKDLSQEAQRKVRTLAGNWQLLSLAPALFLPWRNPILVRFISHKICRLVVPFLLPILLTSCLLLARDPGYRVISGAQLLFYSLALLGALLPGMRKVKVVNLIYFFVTMNLAAASGFWRWVTGQCSTAWQPACTKGVK